MFSHIANITCIDYLAHAMLSVNWLSASKLIATKERRYGLQKVLYLAYVPIAESGIQPKNLSNPKVTFEWPIHVCLKNAENVQRCFICFQRASSVEDRQD